VSKKKKIIKKMHENNNNNNNIDLRKIAQLRRKNQIVNQACLFKLFMLFLGVTVILLTSLSLGFLSFPESDFLGAFSSSSHFGSIGRNKEYNLKFEKSTRNVVGS
jgi:hypothetical protein